MVVRKRKKILKRRGGGSGYGSHKKHRGGGSRGGRGLAGLHKHKRMTSIVHMPDHFGKTGFKRPQKVLKKTETINLKDLDSRIENLLEQGKAKKEKETIRVNISELGYDKLLGTGQIRHRLIVEAKSFSEKAVKKLEEAKGKAVVIENV